MPSDVKVVDPATVAPQPWRNGRGVTRELATGPGWRVSLAELTDDGPFSAFPGMDRVFTPLADGFELVVGGAHVAAHRHRPIAFRGEAAVELRGLDGPARALNVMTERGACRARVSVVVAGTRPAAHTSLRVLLGDHVADVCISPLP